MEKRMIITQESLQRIQNNIEFGRRFTIHFNIIDSFTAGSQHIAEQKLGGSKFAMNSPLDT